MLKMLKKLGIGRMYLNIMKTIYGKPIANIILTGKNLNNSYKVRNETSVSTLIQYSIGIPGKYSKTAGRNKRDPNREGISQIISICKCKRP
jgi:hypothetical protein